ncbi:uncharacterized protein LOC142775064 [Rhipicephalus microplus]|uniref:uncharacterized protein LOC142775064 n=1 Tax=Rhipicephalus microplus TaxID=6941 RepID=UPI003F6ACFB7
MAHQQLPNFDDEKDNWKAYVIKAEAYFEATVVTESAKKRALLVAALSTRTVQILSVRIAPKKPNSLEYEDVVKALDEFFDPERHEIAESFRFFNRCQLDSESVQEFITEICRITNNCNFDTMLDRMLRDRIASGIKSSALQKQMLTKKDLTLEDAETMALAAEAAENDARKMASEASSVLRIKAQSSTSKEVCDRYEPMQGTQAEVVTGLKHAQQASILQCLIAPVKCTSLRLEPSLRGTS